MGAQTRPNTYSCSPKNDSQDRESDMDDRQNKDEDMQMMKPFNG